MNQTLKTLMISVFVLGGLSLSAHAVKISEPAPGFTLKDQNQKERSLSDYKGKYVVLEWLNEGCPFVKKHYNSRNMQKLQKTYTQKGVVWLSIVSSAKGKQGFFSAKEAAQFKKSKHAHSTAILLDTDGKVGQEYEAKTTPHMFVINPEGKLIYAGAIDDQPSTDIEDIKGAKNYVAEALDEALAGQPIVTASTKPYGCSVKY